MNLKKSETGTAKNISRAVVLKPVGIQWTFHRAHLRLSAYQICALQFITLEKLKLWSTKDNNFMDGFPTTWRVVLRGCSIRNVANQMQKSNELLHRKWRKIKAQFCWGKIRNTSIRKTRDEYEMKCSRCGWHSFRHYKLWKSAVTVITCRHLKQVS